MFLSLLHVNAGDDPDRPRPGREWLGNIYRVHQRLWMAFPDDERIANDPFFLGAWPEAGAGTAKPTRREAGFLFRIERDGIPRILVQSAQRPNWQYAFQNAPYLLKGEVRVREFSPELQNGEPYRFRLLANVVERKNATHPDGGTVTTHSGLTLPRRRRTETIIYPQPFPGSLPENPIERGQLLLSRWDPWRKWLQRMGDRRGFCVVDDESRPLRMEAIHTIVRYPRESRAMAGALPKERRYNAGLFEGALICTEADRLRDAVIDGLGNAKAFGFGLLSIAPAG